MVLSVSRETLPRKLFKQFWFSMGQQHFAGSTAVQQQPAADPARDLHGTPGRTEHDAQRPVTVADGHVAGFPGRLAQVIQRLLGGGRHVQAADRPAEVRERHEADAVNRSFFLHRPALVAQRPEQTQKHVLVEPQSRAELGDRQRLGSLTQQFQQPDPFEQGRCPVRIGAFPGPSVCHPTYSWNVTGEILFRISNTGHSPRQASVRGFDSFPIRAPALPSVLH